MPQYFQSQRMVLREPDAVEKVRRLVAEVNAALVEEKTFPADWGITHQVAWEMAPGVHLHYAEDARTGKSFAGISSQVEEKAQRFTNLVSRYLRPYEDEELLHAVDAAEDTRTRAAAVLLVGLGAPHEYDERFFRRIAAALHAEDLTERAAGVFATTYSFWPEYRPLLLSLAETEQDPDLRADARRIAEAPVDQYGNPIEGSP